MYDITDMAECSGVGLAGVRDALVCLLRKKGAQRIRVRDRQIQFRGPWLTGNFNLLAPVSSGNIVLEEEVDGKVRMVWRLSLSRLRYACVGFSLASVVLPLLVGRLAFAYAMIPLGLFLAWGWLYGMNLIFTRLRFRSAVRKATGYAFQRGPR